MGKLKKWSAKQKFEIALCALKGDTTINAICQRYQVAPSQVHQWKKQLLEQGADVFAKNNQAAKAKVLDQERQQKKLYETIGQLTVERDYLKKSVSGFPHLIDDD